jgi:hypothetical protein
VLFDGEGKMYLDAGFEKFACPHSLEVGWLQLCGYEDYGDISIGVLITHASACTTTVMTPVEAATASSRSRVSFISSKGGKC